MSGLSSTLGGRWWAKALGLLLIPVLIATGLLAATWKSDTRLSKVQAAIVNLDKSVTINGQTVPMGRQLSAQLISAEQGQNFTWVLADASHASDGLKSGRYAAVVTIPENFSAAATSYAGTASAAQQATIEVSTSPVAGIADTAVGQSRGAGRRDRAQPDIDRGLPRPGLPRLQHHRTAVPDGRRRRQEAV